MSVSALICWEAMANSYKEKSLGLRRGPIYFSWPCCTDHQHCRENSAVSQPCRSLLLPDSAYRSATPQKPIIKSLNSSEFKRGDLISKLLFHHLLPHENSYSGMKFSGGAHRHSSLLSGHNSHQWGWLQYQPAPVMALPSPTHPYLSTFILATAKPITASWPVPWHFILLPCPESVQWGCYRMLRKANQGLPG